mgnify:CR=1 FL=1
MSSCICEVRFNLTCLEFYANNTLTELWEWKDIFKVEKGVEALDYVLTQEQIQWDHIFIAIIAVVFRVFSYLLMLLLNRDKRK